jgi:excisionase family DNA binding protein
MASLMFSVAEFCRAHGISRGTFYKLLSAGLAPTAVKIGRRTLISTEAAQEWRRRMEQESAVSGPQAA